MRSRSFSLRWMVVAVVLLFACCEIQVGAAQETILHSFNGSDENDGDEPIGGVVFDAAGNLYGTTFSGGIYGLGTVFKLSPGINGWTQKVLLNFNGEGGNWPKSNLIFDATDNLYGTTFYGGALSDGTAYEVSPSSGEYWNETGLHDFSPFGHDGTYPSAGLVFDKSGNLYGTTPGGGTDGSGTVFELTPLAGGGWKEILLHSFNVNDGSEPFGGLVIDASGNLYGTTGYGGASSACFGGCGVVFELSPNADGNWSEKVLLGFNNNDGANPAGTLLLDASGNLYGMAGGGGLYNWGVIFKLSRSGTGWKETILHNFNSNGVDGNAPTGSLVEDSAGNLFGSTSNGGTYNAGTVFELSPAAGGHWKENVLYSFNPNGTDGWTPGSGPILDSSGNLYGTTESGGAYGAGTVYKIMR